MVLAPEGRPQSAPTFRDRPETGSKGDAPPGLGQVISCPGADEVSAPGLTRTPLCGSRNPISRKLKMHSP